MISLARTVGVMAALLIAHPANATVCYFETNGKIVFQGRCHFVPQGGGSFKIFDSEEGFRYFANVLVDATNQGRGYWNGNPGLNHAHTPLGDLYRVEGCWINQTTRICAWK